MNQLLLEGGAFSETDLLELLRRCIEAHDSRIVLKGDASDLQTLDNLVSNECSKMLEPLGIKVHRFPCITLWRERLYPASPLRRYSGCAGRNG